MGAGIVHQQACADVQATCLDGNPFQPCAVALLQLPLQLAPAAQSSAGLAEGLKCGLEDGCGEAYACQCSQHARSHLKLEVEWSAAGMQDMHVELQSLE